MKSNKKFLQFIAAVAILMFHLWIPCTGSEIESFIIKTAYIGVDLFFFVSAYSLADKDILLKDFYINRFFTIYVKFVLFVIIAAIYKGMTTIKVIKVLTLVDFFERGGGAFLWFIPAILIFYVLYPLFIRWDNKYKIVIVIIAWFIISTLVENIIGYNKIYIFTNRIPVLLLGYILKKNNIPGVISAICLPVGIVVTYILGYRYRLNIPFTEIYFVTGIFTVVGLYGISKFVKTSKLWDILSSGTLELYAIQMIFGVKIVTEIHNLIRNNLVTNIIMIISLFGMSIIFSNIYKMIIDVLRKIVENRHNYGRKK